MSNQIVTVNISETAAAAPNTLQKTGALISQGGTSTSANTKTLLTQLSDLTPILAAAKALASLTWSGSVVTGTTSAPHGWTNTDVVKAVIAGATPSGYNGTFSITITGASTFTYPLVSNPGSETIPGTVILADEAELLAMATTFFAQGNTQSVYVLELGEGTPAEGVTALGAYITANPGVFYSYLVPREWDGESTFHTFLTTFNALSAKTYFWVTSATGTYSAYTSAQKAGNVLIEAPGIGGLEFSQAAPFYKSLNYAPSPTNKVTPLAFSFLFDVTAYPPAGNATLFASLKTAKINIVGTGAEGGLSNTIEFWGTNLDGSDFTYWYAVDWAQINGEQDLAQAVINGSNNPLAPLYYDQNGINRLQAVLQGTMNRGVTLGLLLGPVTVSAIPFKTYVADNPNDYASGTYNGLSATFTPNRGFKAITINLNVSNLPAA